MIGIGIEHGEYPRDYHLGNVGHSVAEIWSNEHQKWVVMDPDVNVYYRRQGLPLNALEIRNAWLDGEAGSVEMVQDEPEFVVPSERTLQILRQQPAYHAWSDEVVPLVFERFARNRVMDYYARVRINGWEWVDEGVLPCFVSHFTPYAVMPSTNPDDLYWTLNLVRLSATPSWEGGQAKLGIEFEHCMPYFDHYEVRLGEGQWRRVRESFDWLMREGVNVLECRAVNVRGRPGVVSRLDVAYARALEW